jgi:hypothetical protein
MYRYELGPGSSPEVNKTSNEKTRRKRTAWRLALSCDEPLIELEGSREQKVAKIAKKESRQ